MFTKSEFLNLRICEICSSTACNVVGFGDSESIEQWTESNTTVVQSPPAETQRFWQGHWFLNFLLAWFLPLSSLGSSTSMSRAEFFLPHMVLILKALMPLLQT